MIWKFSRGQIICSYKYLAPSHNFPLLLPWKGQRKSKHLYFIYIHYHIFKYTLCTWKASFKHHNSIFQASAQKFVSNFNWIPLCFSDFLHKIWWLYTTSYYLCLSHHNILSWPIVPLWSEPWLPLQTPLWTCFSCLTPI